MEELRDMNDIFSSINDILANVKLDDVTSEASGNSELPEGYYLSEVVKAEITASKSTGNPQVAFQLKTVENGIKYDIDDLGNKTKSIVSGTKGRYIFLYYPLKDERSIKKFVSDMLKFEGEPGESLLPKEAFTTAETIDESLEVLTGMNINVQISASTNKDGETSIWRNLVSWKRMTEMEEY